MNMFDEARAFDGMIKIRKMTQSELARHLGTSQSYVANKLRLLAFSSDEEERIVSAGLTERHARALLRLSGDARREALEKTADRDLTVRECEALVDFLHDGEAPLLIGRAEACDRVRRFTETVEASVRTLRSIGVDATVSRSYHGKKTYLTVCIKE